MGLVHPLHHHHIIIYITKPSGVEFYNKAKSKAAWVWELELQISLSP